MISTLKANSFSFYIAGTAACAWLVAFALVLAGNVPAAHAANATWTGASNPFSLWSEPGNWSANPVPGTGNTATFDSAGGVTDTIDLVGGVTIQNITFDTANAAAYTIGAGAVNSQSLTINSGGSISMTASVNNHQVINATLITQGNLTLSNASTTRTLTLAGNVASTSTGMTLTKTGAGLVTVSGTNSWVASNSGNFNVIGGGELRLTGGQNIFNASSGTGLPRSYLGGTGVADFSGGNTLRLQSGGRMITAGITIGGGTYTAGNTYGNNALIVSTPGSSGSPSWNNRGSQGSDIYDFGASVLGENTDGNSIQISNGAYVNVPSGGKSFFIGANHFGTVNGTGDYVAQGGNSNYVSIAGANTIFNRQSSNATYVGDKGNGNYIDITAGGRFNAGRLGVGMNGDNNYVRVSGGGSILNGGGADILAVGGGNGFGEVAAGATPSGNYILIENGGTMTFTANATPQNSIGNVNGANNNYIKATGSGSSVQIVQNRPLYIGGSNVGGDTTASGNYFAIEDGATGIVSSINAGGVLSKVKIGSGTANIAQLEIRSTPSPAQSGIFLKNADARLEINNGRLLAGINGASTPASMVNGPGQIDIKGNAYFSTTFSGSTIDSVIMDGTNSGGTVIKEGAGTLEFTTANTYGGDTHVVAGTLRLDQLYLADTSTVFIDSGAKMNLAFSGSDTIGALYLGGILQAPGTYGRTGSVASNQSFALDAFFNNFPLNTFGMGVLNVVDSQEAELVPEPATWTLAALGLLGLSLVARYRRKSFVSEFHDPH